MAILIALEVLIASGGIVGAASSGPSSTDPMARALEQIGWRGDATLSGSPQTVTDALGDQSPGAWQEADLKSGEYAVAPVVPSWVLDALFPCQTVAFCSTEVDPSAFDNGALLVMIETAAPPRDLGQGDSGEWGPLLSLPGTITAPADNASYPLSTVAYVTRIGPQDGGLYRLVYENGDFVEERSSARSVWFDAILITIIPMNDEVRGKPSAWDAVASVEGLRETVATKDMLRPTGAALLPFSNPPTLTFHAQPGESP
jgi:hypothetical protein